MLCSLGFELRFGLGLGLGGEGDSREGKGG